ncbi:MAG: DUF1573 domain-containing protein [Prevotellaceae bacterium]|jgi:hypothetical protein|nr:DUF1573 domain-containing protein [Prevotellaceae bacterium]
MRKLFSTITTLLFASAVLAQMQFSKTQHDFGQVQETGGEIAYSFEFTNTGKAPVIITDVKSSCGCTTPEWTKQPVLPGKTGFVKAIFDPKDRPGIFDKEITVSTKSEQVKLKITGEVIPKTKGTADIYPRTMGSLRLKSNNIPFSNIYNTATASETLAIINTGNTPLSIAFASVPEHITLSVQPQTLKANETGTITCVYNAFKKNDWGYVTDRVGVTINGKSDKGYELTVSASVDEDFSAVNEANAPVAQFASRSITVEGHVKQGDSKEFSISITNNGKSDLLIRKVTTNCDCISLAGNNPTNIKAGQAAELKATFNPGRLKGKVNKTVTVITNAPKQFSTVVRVSATVE